MDLFTVFKLTRPPNNNIHYSGWPEKMNLFLPSKCIVIHEQLCSIRCRREAADFGKTTVDGVV